MTPIPYNLILMIANKVLNRTPFIPPEVLLQIFRQVSSCANPANSLRSITLASRYHALVAREVLWRTVTFIGEQRTRHRKWFSAEMRKYTFIRLIASCNSSPLPPFLPLIRRLELVASSDHQDWMYDAKMVQIVKAISGHDGLRHLRIQSATFRQIVFTRFIDTIFPSLNSTLLELSLDNVVLFDPSVFNTLLSLQFIRFEGVFFKGIKVDAQLVDVIEDNGMENTSGPSSPAKWLAWRVSDTDLIPPQDIIHPRIRSFTYARCSLAVDSYLGPAQERILSYLDLSELSTANFRLRYEDDYLTLATVLQQASTTLRVLILDVSYTASNADDPWLAPVNLRLEQLASTLNLDRLVLCLRNDDIGPSHLRGMAGIARVLSVLKSANTAALEMEVISIHTPILQALTPTKWQSIDPLLVSLAEPGWRVMHVKLTLEGPDTSPEATGDISNIPTVSILFPLASGRSFITLHPLKLIVI